MTKAGDIYLKLKKVNFEEVLERDIAQFGNSSHIILPREHKGKKATIIIHSKNQNKNHSYKEGMLPKIEEPNPQHPKIIKK